MKEGSDNKLHNSETSDTQTCSLSLSWLHYQLGFPLTQNAQTRCLVSIKVNMKSVYGERGERKWSHMYN